MNRRYSLGDGWDGLRGHMWFKWDEEFQGRIDTGVRLVLMIRYEGHN
jgi:hypothetical protein